ncbi:amidase [Blastococcus fimeti]|nr:amidase [Blastococcus fimeti]
MPVSRPSADDLSRIAKQFHFTLDADQLETFGALLEAGPLVGYDALDAMESAVPEVRYERGPATRPEPADNPYGAWYVTARIEGAPDGPLAGKTLAIKDNISVAGIPMMNGSAVLEGFVPAADATVVERILDAGGTILGKSVCEHLCFSGGSHTSDTGPVRNPYDLDRATGGSSSGSAALVAAGVVDMAVGGDQGGSVRMPAGWTGIYGLKPTWGLVPYTGAMPIEPTVDHLGPMARTTADVALLLEVLAGTDGMDPRQGGPQSAPPRQASYADALTGDVTGLRIAVVREGFAIEGLSEPEVDAAVRAAVARYAELGAVVEEVSIPWHSAAMPIWSAVASEGMVDTMLRGNGMGTGWRGRYSPDLLEHFARGQAERADKFSDTVKLTLLAGQWMLDTYGGAYYAKAMNLVPALTAAYDAVLAEYDLLVMPTLPMVATVLPPADAPTADVVARGLEMIVNTAPFDVSGHPAISLPCAMTEAGLPVGMMLIGKHGDERTILRASDAFEKNVFAPPPPPAIG